MSQIKIRDIRVINTNPSGNYRTGFDERLQEVFPGCPELREGYVYANERPGFGIDLDEKLAALYPCDDSVTHWTQTRLPDGTYNNP